MRKHFIFFLSFIFLNISLFAQDVKDIIKWTITTEKTGDNIYNVVAAATIAKDWYLYDADPGGDGTLVPTELLVTPSNTVGLVGKPTTTDKYTVKEIEDLGFSINVHFNQLTYKQKVEVTGNTPVEVVISYMTCNAIDGKCLTPVLDTFKLDINDVVGTYQFSSAVNNDISSAATDNSHDNNGESAPVVASNDEENKEFTSKGLLEIFLMGLANGFIAFLMPCIFAMLPITVSFFTKRSKTRAQGIKNAFFYSISIIFIFAAIGLLISLLFGPKTMYEISSSIWFNLFVFVMFVVFGISLMGAFEITLPSSWSTKLDSKANTNSFIGIFFMALVLVVVSFSCTSAFISFLIVYIVQSGNSLGGIVGFTGFGLAIAIPFALGAIFPAAINKFAKSGGWLNSLKVTMGFIELALAMKFLSNVDLAYHWRLLDMEVYLAIWIAIGICLSLYLLGKLKLSHDGDLPKNIFGQPYLTVTRLMFGIAALSFTIYLVPGLWGAPLTGVSGFLPERKTLDFNLHDQLIKMQTTESGNTVKPVKYTNKLKSELPGIDAFFDYEEALAAAKVDGKLVLVDFTGHSCINCRKMERAVLSKPEVLSAINKDFVLASLYTDDKTVLPEEEQYVSEDGTKIKTLGAKNLDIEFHKFNQVAQPYYAVVNSDGNIIHLIGGYDIIKTPAQFLAELNAALQKK